MEAPKTIDFATPAPEQLLKLMEFEFALERGRRTARPPRKRASFLAAGFVFIVLGAGIALLFAQHLLVEVQRQAQGPATAAEMEEIR